MKSWTNKNKQMNLEKKMYFREMNKEKRLTISALWETMHRKGL